MPRPIFDGHLDLAMNALLYERDQTLPAGAIRELEAGAEDGRGRSTTSVASMREAGVALCVTTLIARTRPVSPARKPVRADLDYPNQAMTHAAARGQLAYYRLLERQGHVAIVADREGLDRHWEAWRREGPAAPLGIILTMEGADPIVEPSELESWHREGLRSLMLAHIGQSVYAMGTLPADGSGTDGPVTEGGREILRRMRGLGMPLDLTHLCDRSFFEALEAFDGPVYASHSNCRALADTPRQLTDEQLRRIVERDGVVGIALHHAMLRGRDTPAEEVGLDAVADHVDRICELAGSARHVAFGTDLDGGFGAEKCPRGIEWVSDLHRLEDLLASRGFPDEDITRFFHGNWLAFWRRVLPSRPDIPLYLVRGRRPRP